MKYLSYDNFTWENVMVFPANFRVKEITPSSRFILADHSLGKGSMIPLELYLNKNDHLNFIGKVFSIRNVEDKEQVSYEVEVTHPDLAEKARAMLKKFIDYLVKDL
jgi:hypothetical protein